MEIKVGLLESPREVVIKLASEPENLEELVRAALTGASEILELVDERGRRVLLRAASIAYVEVGPREERPVGFRH